MQIKIKNARLSFASIRKPYVPKTGDPKFTASLICSEDTIVEFTVDGKKVDMDHYKGAERIIKLTCISKWGKVPGKLELYVYSRADQQVGSRGPKVDEDGEFYDGYTAETYFFSAGTKVADSPDGPLIVGPDRKPLPATSGHPINGDYVNAVINVFAYEYEGKKGVSASLEGIQYLRKGVPFGASKITADAFDEEELEDDEEDADDGSEDDLF